MILKMPREGCYPGPLFSQSNLVLDTRQSCPFRHHQNWLTALFLRALLPIFPFHFIFLAGQNPSNSLFEKITTCLCRENTKLYAKCCRLILCRRSCFVSILIIIVL